MATIRCPNERDALMRIGLEIPAESGTRQRDTTTLLTGAAQPTRDKIHYRAWWNSAGDGRRAGTLPSSRILAPGGEGTIRST